MALLGTRGSELALWQARHIQALLKESAQLEVALQVIRTEGDRDHRTSLAKLQGKGFFTKEIEEALLGGQIDLAVHSHKDLPTQSPPGLSVVAVCRRGPVADCLLVKPEAWRKDEPLPVRREAVIGTGSARRSSQLLALRPDLQIRDLRGNVPTRIAKVRQGQYDAIVLAKAGLERLGSEVEPLQVYDLTLQQMVPAPAQGALAVQMREDPGRRPGERKLRQAVASLHHEPTALCVAAERGLLALLEGGCQLPLGAYAVRKEGGVRLLAAMGLDEGGLRRCEVVGDSPETAARRAFEIMTADRSG